MKAYIFIITMLLIVACGDAPSARSFVGPIEESSEPQISSESSQSQSQVSSQTSTSSASSQTSVSVSSTSTSTSTSVSTSSSIGSSSSSTSVQQFYVEYNNNSAAVGSVPTKVYYAAGTTVTISANPDVAYTSGAIRIPGWNTSTYGTGTTYACGQTVVLNSNLTLYIRWSRFSMINIPARTQAFMVGDSDMTYSYEYVGGLTAYALGTTEVTYCMWTNVRDWATAHGYVFLNPGQMGSDATGTGMTPQHPVTKVSYQDVVAWLNALSEMTGFVPVYYNDYNKTMVYRDATNKTCDLMLMNGTMSFYCAAPNYSGFRLPTEAEWEYPTRYGSNGVQLSGVFPAGYAGSTVATDPAATILANWGPYCWYSGNSNGKTHPVRLTTPTYAGNYDQSGNVSEWVNDWMTGMFLHTSTLIADYPGDHNGNQKAVRGGSYSHSAANIRTAWREAQKTDYSAINIGFRIASRQTFTGQP